MKQLWKKFDKLTEICYMSELEDNCPQWDEAYEVFKQLVAQGREKDPQYAAEILKMDDATDYMINEVRTKRFLNYQTLRS